MADESTKFSRSPNFPFIPLELALQRAAQMYASEKRSWAPLSVVAPHWNYSMKSSALQQTVGALKNYGLLEDEGKSLDRRIRLTDLALRILLDSRPDSSDRERLIKQAALNPAVARAILDRYPDPPSDSNLQHFLIFDLKFNPDSARQASRVFFENKEFARLYDSQGDGTLHHSGELENESMQAVEPVATPSSAPVAVMAQPSGSSSQTNPQSSAAARTVKVETVMDSDNEPISIHFVTPPTVDSYELLKEYFDIRIRALKRKAGTGTEPEKKSEPDKKEEG